MMRPLLARTSSAASGLRFCGMIEEPVVKRSDSSSSPASGEAQITISSAKRDRCTAAIQAESLARQVAIDREGGASQGRGAERTLVEPLARILEAAAVACRHLDI